MLHLIVDWEYLICGECLFLLWGMFWRGVPIDFDSLQRLSMNTVWMESEPKGVGIDVRTCWRYVVCLMFDALLFLWQLSSHSSHPSDADQRLQNSVNSREIL